MGSTQDFAKETSSGSPIPALSEHKFERVTLGIYRPIKLSPNFLDFNVGFVSPPRGVGNFKLRL